MLGVYLERVRVLIYIYEKGADMMANKKDQSKLVSMPPDKAHPKENNQYPEMGRQKGKDMGLNLSQVLIEVIMNKTGA